MRSIIIILFLIASSYSFGQQLVYTPKNPAFGGDTFNYQWLLSSADSQNNFEEDDGLAGLGDLSALNQTLDNQLINQQLDGLPTNVGTSADGNIEYEVFDTLEGLIINILNITSGEQSQIIVPNN